MERLKSVPFKEIDPYIIDIPYRIDLVVKALQASFADITWNEKSFGRATYVSLKEGDKTYTYPSMHVGEGLDGVDMLLQDNFDSFSFFVADGDESIDDFYTGAGNIYKRNLRIIFWLNLERVPYKNLERLKAEVLSKIRGTTYPQNGNSVVTERTVTGIVDKPKDVFEGFTLDLEESQYMYYPYSGFAIDLSCGYSEDC